MDPESDFIDESQVAEVPESTASQAAGSEQEDEVVELPVRTMQVPPEAQGVRLDIFLTQILDGYSRVQIRKAVQEGGAEVDGRAARPSLRLKPGQWIRFQVPPNAEPGPRPEPITLSILYEDDGLVAVNKPPGMVVHPARGHWFGTLTSALAFHFQSLSDIGGPTRPGIVHRLDRDTSGVILVAKTNAVHMNLAAQFEGRSVAKTYIAITTGVPDRDRDWIDQPIGLHPYQREKMAIRGGHPSSREAQTFYEVLERYRGFALLRLKPKTGRTHQIRVHLDHIGYPILCDRLYAGRSVITQAQALGQGGVTDSPPLLNRQALHAAEIEIDHPQTSQRIKFSAALPDDMREAIEFLRRHRSLTPPQKSLDELLRS